MSLTKLKTRDYRIKASLLSHCISRLHQTLELEMGFKIHDFSRFYSRFKFLLMSKPKHYSVIPC